MPFMWLVTRKPEAPRMKLGYGASDEYINGFPGAASFIACDPDHSFAIYKAFHSLSARNLLHLEAELLELQQDQNDLDERIALGDLEDLKCFRSWKALEDSVDSEQQQRKRMNKLIQVKIKEYHEALLLQQQVFKIGKPQKEPLEALKLWLDGKSDKSRTAKTFVGTGATRLDDEKDLVALHPQIERDWITRLVGFSVVRHFFLESHVDDHIALYSTTKMDRVIGILSIMVATMLFITTMVSLYLVTGEKLRLGLICVFTLAFALSVELLTNARRAELFAATAAYCAVLVVFVSGSLGSDSEDFARRA